MKWASFIPRILGALSVAVFGPVIGVLVGLILAILALPDSPGYFRHGVQAALGDGFLILLYIAISLVASIPLSIFGAGLILIRRSDGAAHFFGVTALQRQEHCTTESSCR